MGKLAHARECPSAAKTSRYWRRGLGRIADEAASGVGAGPHGMLLLEQVAVTSKETGEMSPRLLEAFRAARSREGEAPKGEQEENVPSREVARVGHDTRNWQADDPLDVRPQDGADIGGRDGRRWRGGGTSRQPGFPSKPESG